MSDTRARASRRAFWLGSLARNGLIGLRGTTAGDGAGVDGVENAADTFPPLAKAVVELSLVAAGDSGIVVRDGGVNGAPNDIDSVDGDFCSFAGSARGVACGAGDFPDGFAGSCGTAEEILGEKGGVRVRGVEGAGPPDAGSTGGAGAGGRGGVAARRSTRGTGGGQATAPAGMAAAACAGVPRRTGFTPLGVDSVAAPPTGATTGSSSPQLMAAPTGIKPPQTEQRARIEMLVIFAGSRRNTERHSGQETFIENASWVESGIRDEVVPE